MTLWAFSKQPSRKRY